MVAERVSVREGVLPLVIVAPHGPDDPFTDTIAETMAEEIDAYAVLNHGWERADAVDPQNDKANCNSIKHCHEDVVKDEFLDLLRFVYRSRKTIFAAKLCPFLQAPLMITIHGVGNDIRNQVKVPVDMVLGTGDGQSFSPHVCCVEERSTCLCLNR